MPFLVVPSFGEKAEDGDRVARKTHCEENTQPSFSQHVSHRLSLSRRRGWRLGLAWAHQPLPKPM